MCAGNRWWDHGICVLVTDGEPWYVCAGNRWGTMVCVCW